MKLLKMCPECKGSRQLMREDLFSGKIVNMNCVICDGRGETLTVKGKEVIKLLKWLGVID